MSFGLAAFPAQKSQGVRVQDYPLPPLFAALQWMDEAMFERSLK
jgi:hypothetical protein